jgi:hypothetical protein
MQCRSCGAETPAEAVYCPKCGARINGAAEPGSAAAETPSAAEKFREAAGAESSSAESKEQGLWEGDFSGKAMFGSWLAASLATIVLFVAAVYWKSSYGWWGLLVLLALIWGGLACRLAYYKLSVHYELTTQRFIHKRGILTRVTDRIEVIDIDDVAYQQGFVERLLGVGTIKIVSSDRTDPELLLRGIDEVSRVADMIDDARRTERRRRGLHIEQI